MSRVVHHHGAQVIGAEAGGAELFGEEDHSIDRGQCGGLAESGGENGGIDTNAGDGLGDGIDGGGGEAAFKEDAVAGEVALQFEGITGAAPFGVGNDHTAEALHVGVPDDGGAFLRAEVTGGEDGVGVGDAEEDVLHVVAEFTVGIKDGKAAMAAFVPPMVVGGVGGHPDNAGA